jgi:hypothetical protein
MRGRDLALRRVEPEWLDEMPPADPRAVRSRRDLRRVNAIMGNARFIARALQSCFPGEPPCSVVELGAGDGSVLLRVARSLPASWQGVAAVLLDRLSLADEAVLHGLAARGWSARFEAADVFEWLSRSSGHAHDAIIVNLFLHHFETGELRELLRLAAARSTVFVACEPRRAGVALRGSRLLGVIGCNDVTRHDAVASVAAGFAGAELSALWPTGGGWTLSECPRGLFAHLFVASRTAPGVPAMPRP